jgi:hypothetical protein
MYALNIDPNNPQGNPSGDQLRALSVEIVRYTYHDSSGGEGLDQQRAGFFSQKAEEYRQAGIRSLIILSYDTLPGKPDWDAPDPAWPDYIERFARRAGQIAALLAPFQPAFQIWNEPDHPGQPGYNPQLPEAVYGHMLRRTHDAIKAVDPNALIVTAGLSSGNPAWLTRVIESQGGDLHADVVAFHPYGQRPDPDWPHPDWFFGYVGNLLNAYFEAGQRRTLWITEMGSPEQDLGGDRLQVAELLRRYYRAMTTRFSDKVEHLFWFCYSDGMVPTFGLLDQVGNPKPALDAFRNEAASLAVGVPKGAARPAPGAPPLFGEALTPSTSTFVVPFRQHITLEVARLEAQIKLLQDQVKELQGRVAELGGEGAGGVRAKATRAQASGRRRKR